jgi:MOSC domain-containing protein YiiM
VDRRPAASGLIPVGGAAGRLDEIWAAPTAAALMSRRPSGRLVTGVGLAGDRYALGGGTWADWPGGQKQLTLIDADDVAAVARETGSPLTPADTRRNLVTSGVDLPALVGGWFAVGETVLFAAKRCPPCTHLERLTGVRLVKAMAQRGGINAAVVVGGPIREGDAVRPLSEDDAARRGAPAGAGGPLPR